MIFMPFKSYLIVLTLLLLSFVSNAQYPNNEIKPYEPPVFSRYNAVTLGSQLGSSITSTTKSYVFYNFNQISISDRVYTTSYSEYYKDENNYFLSHYLTAQVFLSYKVQPLFIMGLGYKYNNNFVSDQKQNFIQFKVEKTFTW